MGWGREVKHRCKVGERKKQKEEKGPPAASRERHLNPVIQSFLVVAVRDTFVLLCFGVVSSKVVVEDR